MSYLDKINDQLKILAARERRLVRMRDVLLSLAREIDSILEGAPSIVLRKRVPRTYLTPERKQAIYAAIQKGDKKLNKLAEEFGVPVSSMTTYKKQMLQLQAAKKKKPASKE